MAKTKEKTKNKAVKSSKKELTPLEKARIAKASGKTKAKKSKKKVHIFKAPEGFKPFFMKVGVLIDKDGIITDMKATRVKGGAGNFGDEKKTVDMLEWDPDTVRRLLGRYAAVAFVRNEAKRLPQGLGSMLMRVGANRETGALRVAIKDIKFKEGKDGKLKALDKKDAKYRLLRKPARFLAAAFTKVKDFPSAAEKKAMMKAEEVEDDEVLVKKSTGKAAKLKTKKSKKARKGD